MPLKGFMNLAGIVLNVKSVDVKAVFAGIRRHAIFLNRP